MNKNCEIPGSVYEVTCKICNNKYNGEAHRTAGERLSDHLRYAANPDCKSYKDQAFAEHYKSEHPGEKPNLEFKILHQEQNTTKRKIKEAITIFKNKPEINNKLELGESLKFIQKHLK